MKLPQIFSDEEWELLCDQCGVCCFYKIEDEDTEEIFFTMVYCSQFFSRIYHSKRFNPSEFSFFNFYIIG